MLRHSVSTLKVAKKQICDKSRWSMQALIKRTLKQF